jgi:hypothetical protein
MQTVFTARRERECEYSRFRLPESPISLPRQLRGQNFEGEISKKFLRYRGQHPWTTNFPTRKCFSPFPRKYAKLLRNHTQKLCAIPGKLLPWNTSLQPDDFSVVCIRHFVPLQLISATSEQCAAYYRSVVRQLSEQLVSFSGLCYLCVSPIVLLS